MTSVYIAAPYAARDLAYNLALRLRDRGVVVTSQWILGTREINHGSIGASSDSDHSTVEDHAIGDFRDIEAADYVVMLASSFTRRWLPDVPEEWLHTGGRHVEVGYALARLIPVFVIGEPENVFERTLCSVHAEFSEVVEHLTGLPV